MSFGCFLCVCEDTGALWKTEMQTQRRKRRRVLRAGDAGPRGRAPIGWEWKITSWLCNAWGWRWLGALKPKLIRICRVHWRQSSVCLSVCPSIRPSVCLPALQRCVEEEEQLQLKTTQIRATELSLSGLQQRRQVRIFWLFYFQF